MSVRRAQPSSASNKCIEYVDVRRAQPSSASNKCVEYVAAVPRVQCRQVLTRRMCGLCALRGAGKFYYHNRKSPWLSSPDKPPGILPCAVCQMQFATRQCQECAIQYCLDCHEKAHPKGSKSNPLTLYNIASIDLTLELKHTRGLTPRGRGASRTP